MKKFTKFDYDKPIKILSYKRPWFDIFFYSAILSILMLAIIYLLFIQGGKFVINFELWRVLVSIPLIMLCYLFKQLLDELRIYPRLLMRKNIWKINELMEMTKKDREETERIMNRILDVACNVDPKCIKKD